MTRLLLPQDGSPAALHAAEMLAGYAGEPARLAPRVLNVQTRPLSFWPDAALDVRAVEAALLDAGRDALKPAVERLAAAGIPVDAAVRLGRPADTIAREAAAYGAAAIIMGTRGHGALQGFALGSVALRVAHGAGLPVLLVKPEDRLPGTLGARIKVLLAMDGSEPALRAAERLAAWRAWLGEPEVHIAYVQEPLSMLEVVLPPHDDVIGQWSTKQGEQATEKARELFSRENIAQHLHLSVGDAPRELRTLAEQAGADLVVLGTRGLGAAHHALVGSVALKSVVLSGVPVLLVP
jgi:nucleotide-binding universal stress UspA family protein